MNDPRWQRAMGRLGLERKHESRVKYFYHDPDDPATFLRVIDAVNKAGFTVVFEPGFVCVASADNKLHFEAADLCEAVMEAFGKE